jgi:hypothetical protein
MRLCPRMYWQSLWFESPAVDSSARGSLLPCLSKEELVVTLRSVKQSPIAAAKAERERDKMQAMRDYEAKKLASQANMARLRALRLAKECTNSQAPSAQRPAKGK